MRRVLDSCQKQISAEGSVVDLSGAPVGVAPFTFVGATSTAVSATVTDLVVTRIDDKPNLARVQCLVTVPLSVTFRDANGAISAVVGGITVAEDIVLHVPCPSKFPFEIVASACCNCPSGTYDATANIVRAVACAEVITKVTCEADLMVHTFGYCAPPNAVDFDAEECKRFFNTPLYPQN